MRIIAELIVGPAVGVIVGVAKGNTLIATVGFSEGVIDDIKVEGST